MASRPREGGILQGAGSISGTGPGAAKIPAGEFQGRSLLICVAGRHYTSNPSAAGESWSGLPVGNHRHNGGNQSHMPYLSLRRAHRENDNDSKAGRYGKQEPNSEI